MQLSFSIVWPDASKAGSSHARHRIPGEDGQHRQAIHAACGE
jgi:hypothetical protein